MTEKLFYADSYMQTFEAEVLSCTACKAGYEVELNRTAFFPEGGGQYADTGRIGSYAVTDVQERDGRIFHLIPALDAEAQEGLDEEGGRQEDEGVLRLRSASDGAPDRASDDILRVLYAGRKAECRIDWDERFMKMQQHTGEHIVSGLVHERFGYDNVGFHLGSVDCTMDFNGEITREELAEIEQAANRAVWENLDVQVLYPSKEELEKMDYRSKIEIEGQVRIVVIPGYDVCACCAPHVRTTGEIGVIKLTNVQRYKGGVRVTMLCGVRALADYARKQAQAQAISAMLCAKENELAEAVERLKEECAALKLEITEKEKEIVRYEAKQVADEEEVVCLFTEDMGADSMRGLMNLVLEKERMLCAVFCGRDGDGYRYVIGSRTQDVRGICKEMNGKFDGRGGGRPEMAQGTVRGNADEIKKWILDRASAKQSAQPDGCEI